MSEWIPCSERLPKKNEIVLIFTDGFKEKWEEQRFIEFGKIDTKEGYETRWWFLYESSSDYWGPIAENCVIAWQPLPKPYGARMENEK